VPPKSISLTFARSPFRFELLTLFLFIFNRLIAPIRLCHVGCSKLTIKHPFVHPRKKFASYANYSAKLNTTHIISVFLIRNSLTNVCQAFIIEGRNRHVFSGLHLTLLLIERDVISRLLWISPVVIAKIGNFDVPASSVNIVFV
jgi:hypothetical protein